MSNKYKEKTGIVRQEQIAPDIYSLWIRAERIADGAVPGQFLSVYCDEASRLLPRPLSICETDGKDLRLVYRVVGDGTREFSEKRPVTLCGCLGLWETAFPCGRKKRS